MENTTKEYARMLLVLLSIVLTIAGFWLLLEVWNFLELNMISKKPHTKYAMAEITFVPWCIAQYFLTTSIIISLCAWHKKGFANLKPIKEDGIKRWMLVRMPIAGIPLGLISGILPIPSFIAGFISASVVMIIWGTLLGLANEYSKQYPEEINKETVKNILLKYKGEDHEPRKNNP